MRALRRIATPATVAVALGGCTHPVDEFHAPASNDAALTTNGDAAYASYDSGVVPPADAAPEEDTQGVELSDSAPAIDDATSDAVVVYDDSGDASSTSCVCVKQLGGKCKEWSPPGCSK